MTEIRVVSCFLSVRRIFSRDFRTERGFRATWIARGTGTALYTSTLSPTAARARELAYAFAKRNPWLVDTTAPAVLAVFAKDDGCTVPHVRPTPSSKPRPGT